jgi:hypothetical protein
MDKKDVNQAIAERKKKRDEMRKSLVNRADVSGFMDNPNVSEKLKKEEVQLRDIVNQRKFLMTHNEMAKVATEKLGKRVSKTRIAKVIKRMRQEERAEFNKTTSQEAAFRSFETYADLKDQLGQLILDAESITDSNKRVNAKRMILDKYRQTQEAEDKMFKMCGIHREQIVLEQLDIRDTQQWKSFQNAILIYLRYVLKCPDCGHKGFNPELFINFIENVARDPHYVDQFISIKTRKNTAWRKMQREEESYADYVDVDPVGESEDEQEEDN